MITGQTWAKGAGYEPTFGWLAFFPNGTSDPDLTAVEGPLKRWVSSIAYSATGGYVITFTSDFAFATMPEFSVSPYCDGASNWFDVFVDGAYSQTTKALTVRAHRAGTGNAVAASANAKIVVTMLVNNTGGK